LEQPIDQKVWSEQAMMELLGVNRKQLARLIHDKNLPVVRLTRNIKVFFADEVLTFLEEVRQRR